MSSVVIITGSAGGIGSALCDTFADAGYDVISVDILPPSAPVKRSTFVDIDLNKYCCDTEYRNISNKRLREAIGGKSLSALINNAAIQIVKPAIELSTEDWNSTINVNMLAPFLLTRDLLAELEVARGSVVNISSIHARLTKPGFAAYATSKAALDGLTRSLAIELGGRVRINSIAPAAISTPMLVAGFEGRSAEFQQLGELHPVGRIGEPIEVAKMALYLASDAAMFINGASLSMDGGIGCRLHDPV